MPKKTWDTLHLSSFQNPSSSFHYIGRFIGIPLLAYLSPQYIGYFFNFKKKPFENLNDQPTRVWYI